MPSPFFLYCTTSWSKLTIHTRTHTFSVLLLFLYLFLILLFCFHVSFDDDLWLLGAVIVIVTCLYFVGVNVFLSSLDPNLSTLIIFYFLLFNGHVIEIMKLLSAYPSFIYKRIRIRGECMCFRLNVVNYRQFNSGI